LAFNIQLREQVGSKIEKQENTLPKKLIHRGVPMDNQKEKK
jgi:hypothetical protein